MIRRAGAPDAPALLGLIQAFYVEDGHPYDEAHVLGALTPLLADDTYGQVWVVCADDSPAEARAPVGYAVLSWGWGLESGGREGLVDEIFTARRGEGLGAELLEHVIAAARDAGCRTLFLETERANDAARRFYARHGLTEQNSVWMSRDV